MNTPQLPLIRYACLDDLNQLAPLFNAYRVFYKQESQPQIASDFLKQRLALSESVILLACGTNQQALGFIQLYPSFCSISAARTWLLSDLFVSEAARGRGIARLLMNKAREHAVQTGAVRIDLSTAHDNQRAQALYQSLSYQQDHIYQYYGLDIR